MRKLIVAVTGCPTGIAHTFMAAESLKKTAEDMGIEIRVETSGAIGVENALTEQEIEQSIGVIVACDKNTDLERFNGKQVLEVSVSEGINKAGALIQTVLDGMAPVRNGQVKNTTTQPRGQESVGRNIYKHLMNGVSNMLPFVVAGGVLIAISFLWGIFSFDPDSNQYNAFAAMLKNIGGTAMGIMVPVFAAFIAQSIANRPGMVAGFVGGLLAASTGSGFIGGILAGFAAGYIALALVKAFSGMPKQFEGLKSIFLIPLISVTAIGMIMMLTAAPVSAINASMMSFLAGLQDSSPLLLGLVVGCMCAFDFGGPVNKAAYVTGTMLLGLGNYFFMAGVSAACITPPLIVGLATTIFHKQFSEEERAAGLVNYILGFTHITEGAIPFVAKNPLVLIPIMMAGSSISAILSYMLHIQVPAPHGGFLILPLMANEGFGGISNAVTWVGCILIGSAIGAVLFGVYQTRYNRNNSIKYSTDKG